MKLTKLFIFLTLLAVTNFAQSPQPIKETTPAQRTSDISDSDFEDVQMTISGTFAERKVVGKVVGVHDGDTATVLDKYKTQYKFRFNGIDAPELKMDFGNKSKQNLSDLIFGKEVTVVFDKQDKYGRYVGKILVNGMDANLEQIKAGLAWHYKKYASEQSETDRKTYAEAELKARAEKKGLWQQPNQIAPWDYRADKKVKQAEEKANRKYLVGAKGGCYYINSSGNKTYVKKEFCDGASSTNTKTEDKPKAENKVKTETKTKTETENQPAKIEEKKEQTEKKAAGDRTYIKGAKGGCYYINKNGNKSYVDKELCN